jgi:hypothetical protein
MMVGRLKDKPERPVSLHVRRLFRRELLEQAVQVDGAPVLGQLVAADAHDVGRVERDLPAGGGDTQVGALVGTGVNEVDGDVLVVDEIRLP